MTMLPHSLKSLFLSDIPSLVELPVSIQNFTKLDRLRITDCVNLETLPTSINFQYLLVLDLRGCSRLRTFPDISTNVVILYLARTGIEAVPWWIEKFYRLSLLDMNGCNRLQRVSLHISKLKYLEQVDFSYCKALTEASWKDSSSVVAMETDIIYSKLPVLDEASSSFPDNFINCFKFSFNLDQKPILLPQIDFKNMRLSGEEVPSYFTHRTTGTSSSLTNIPLPQTSLCEPSLFRFKACAKINSKSSPRRYFEFEIQVSCRFKGRLGNHFDSPCRPHKFGKRKGIHLVIFECCFPLNEENAAQAELNYDHVDIHFCLRNLGDSSSKLEGWGIRISDDFPSPKNRLGNSNTVPHVGDNEKQQTDTIKTRTPQETSNFPCLKTQLEEQYNRFLSNQLQHI